MSTFKSLTVSEMTPEMRKKDIFVSEYLAPLVKALDPTVGECFYIVFPDGREEVPLYRYADDKLSGLVDVSGMDPVEFCISVLEDLRRETL